MARTLVWYWPRNREAAERLAEEIGAKVRSLKGWCGYVEERADVVVMDDAPEAIAAYRAIGAEVRMLSGGEVPEPEPEPEPDEPADPKLPAGYSITKAGVWFKVLDAAGNQVGNAKRNEADAIAQVEG